MDKAANVLNALAEIRDAEDKEHATRAIHAFGQTYAAKFPKAVAKIVDDAEGLLAFYDFPAESGKAERQENEYVRHGIANLVAALDVHGGGIFHANTIEANNSTNFCSLLEEVDARVPEGLHIHVVMDNGSSSNEEPSARPRDGGQDHGLHR